MKNVIGKLNTNEYDGQDKHIKTLLKTLREQYNQVLKDKNLSRTRGGSRKKQSKRRLRKTQQRRKRNNRKSKKSKQV